MRYEASKNRGTDAGSLDMSYDFRLQWKEDPILRHALVAFHNAITCFVKTVENS